MPFCVLDILSSFCTHRAAFNIINPSSFFCFPFYVNTLEPGMFNVSALYTCFITVNLGLMKYLPTSNPVLF